MKYIITETRLKNYIFSYFDKLFKPEKCKREYPWDWDDSGKEYEDKTRFTVYNTDDEDVYLFQYYFCEYFNEDARDGCPFVRLDDEYSNQLNSMFDDLWIEPFKEWIKKTFDLDVETVEF